jgi:gluconate 2-dehydrogenase gamma chain
MARSGVSRRELLKRAGLAGTALLALPGLGRVIGVGRDLAAQTRSLTTASLATLRAVCARLIPTDENGPGATEAHAAEYIDRALRSALAPARADYVQGLAAIDRVAQQKFGGSFTRLSAQQQDAVLTDLQDTPFFALVRGHTLQGTFCDPVYGGNADFVGWDLLGYPGVRLSVTAAEQNMSTPATPRHISAYDSAMFSRTGIDGD